jgi:hypothetical protein
MSRVKAKTFESPFPDSYVAEWEDESCGLHVRIVEAHGVYKPFWRYESGKHDFTVNRTYQTTIAALRAVYVLEFGQH